MVAQYLGQELGQSIVVENHPGAGGSVGTQILATSKPDGYTLELASTSPISIVPYLVKNLGYSPREGSGADLAGGERSGLGAGASPTRPSRPSPTWSRRPRPRPGKFHLFLVRHRRAPGTWPRNC